MAENIVWHDHAVSTKDRERQRGHRGLVLWFTGLSGSGKSTLAGALEEVLYRRGCHTYVLDGDNIRHGLCADLDFSPAGRQENIRRVGEVAKLMAEAGLIVLTAFISPYRQERASVAAMLGPSRFVEIFVDTPLSVCEQRDPKGLYQKARKGEISAFTGIDSPYEPPLHADIHLDGRLSAETLVEQVLKILDDRQSIALC